MGAKCQRAITTNWVVGRMVSFSASNSNLHHKRPWTCNIWQATMGDADCMNSQETSDVSLLAQRGMQWLIYKWKEARNTECLTTNRRKWFLPQARYRWMNILYCRFRQRYLKQDRDITYGKAQKLTNVDLAYSTASVD